MSPVSETDMAAKERKHCFLKAHVVLRQSGLDFRFRDVSQFARRPEGPRKKKQKILLFAFPALVVLLFEQQCFVLFRFVCFLR